jgi:hypothetical protein
MNDNKLNKQYRGYALCSNFQSHLVYFNCPDVFVLQTTFPFKLTIVQGYETSRT